MHWNKNAIPSRPPCIPSHPIPTQEPQRTKRNNKRIYIHEHVAVSHEPSLPKRAKPANAIYESWTLP
jgi:hypothetical protein